VNVSVQTHTLPVERITLEHLAEEFARQTESVERVVDRIIRGLRSLLRPGQLTERRVRSALLAVEDGSPAVAGGGGADKRRTDRSFTPQSSSGQESIQSDLAHLTAFAFQKLIEKMRRDDAVETAIPAHGIPPAQDGGGEALIRANVEVAPRQRSSTMQKSFDNREWITCVPP
jgi:hypothetical protein